jgi:hypothetical protein
MILMAETQAATLLLPTPHDTPTSLIWDKLDKKGFFIVMFEG